MGTKITTFNLFEQQTTYNNGRPSESILDKKKTQFNEENMAHHPSSIFAKGTTVICLLAKRTETNFCALSVV